MTRVRPKFNGFVTVRFGEKAAGSLGGRLRAGGLGAPQHAGDADGEAFGVAAGGGGAAVVKLDLQGPTPYPLSPPASVGKSSGLKP